MPTIVGSPLDADIIGEFLQTCFDEGASSVNPINSGLFSQAFSFVVDSQEFILRVNPYEEDFKKDAFAYHHYAGPMLPIPRVVRLGRFDDSRYFAITERCEGQTLNKLNEADVHAMVPRLFETLSVVHSVDVSGYQGWGLTDVVGNGLFDSWQAYILSMYNQKYAFDWSDLAQHTVFEKDVFAVWLEEMKQLLRFCPSEKYLVHGDFGSHNVMSDGQRITGVLDWADSRLGDFIYDIALLDFWYEGISFGALWNEWAAAQRLDIPYFEERMRCYVLREGLDSMAFNASQGDEAGYVRVKARLRSLLQPGKWEGGAA